MFLETTGNSKTAQKSDAYKDATTLVYAVNGEKANSWQETLDIYRDEPCRNASLKEIEDVQEALHVFKKHASFIVGAGPTEAWPILEGLRSDGELLAESRILLSSSAAGLLITKVFGE